MLDDLMDSPLFLIALVASFIPLEMFRRASWQGEPGNYVVTRPPRPQELATPGWQGTVVTLYYVDRNFWEAITNPFPGGL